MIKGISKYYITALIVVLIYFQCLAGISSAVTYTFSGGRFGDCLLSYCHAKWISYKYQIPLLYKPFDYSDQLMMHVQEMHYTPDLETQYTIIEEYTVDTVINRENGTLYVVPFFPESIFNRYDTVFPFLFVVEWEDPIFKSMLQQTIKPIMTYLAPPLPADSVSVAVHIRKGTGWDIPNYRITPEQLTASHPLRFAPDSFYIEQLKKIDKIYLHEKIYVYLFTDHNDPAQLAFDYAQAVNCDRMTFDYRRTINNEFINVLEDFFALTYFDCLIRADSNFSIIASKLGDYTLQISPWHGIVMEGRTIIDEIQVVIGQQKLLVHEHE